MIVNSPLRREIGCLDDLTRFSSQILLFPQICLFPAETYKGIAAECTETEKEKEKEREELGIKSLNKNVSLNQGCH